MIAVLPALPLVGVLLGHPVTCTGAVQAFGLAPRYLRTFYRCAGTPFRSLTLSQGFGPAAAPVRARLCRTGPRPPGWRRPHRSRCCTLRQLESERVGTFDQLVATSAAVACHGARGTLTLDIAD